MSSTVDSDADMMLAPSFKPPKSVELLRTSEHNKIGILLALRPVFPTDKKHLVSPRMFEKSTQNQDDNNKHPHGDDNRIHRDVQKPTQDISLFDGGIIVRQEDYKEGQSTSSGVSVVAVKPIEARSVSAPKDGQFSSLLNQAGREKRRAPSNTSSGTKRAKSVVSDVSSDMSSVLHQEPIRAVRSGSKSSDRTTYGKEFTSTFWNDIAGIEPFCRNAGACAQSLSLFEELCGKSPQIAMSLLWEDGTSNHSETSRKLCTPSRPCERWNCACDRSVRARQCKRRLVAAAVALSVEEGAHVYLLPLDSANTALKSGVSRETRWAVLLRILQTPTTVKILYHTQVALLGVHIMWARSDAVGGGGMVAAFDPRIAEYLLDSTATDEDLELHRICDRYQVKPTRPVSPSTVRSGRVAQLMAEIHGDLQCLLQVFPPLMERVVSMGLQRLFTGIEMPLAVQLSRMEQLGLCVSLRRLDALAALLREQITDLETAAERLVHQQFNMASPEQVAHVLYNVLQLPAPQSEKKHPSTSEEELLRLTALHPVVEIILDHRYMMKILGTFVEGINSLVVSSTNCDQIGGESRVHACWNQTHVRTGRLSCTKPNLQNIPNARQVRGLEVNVRGMFTASGGRVLVSADYSQIEMRVLAHVSGDEAMKSLFRQSGDIYILLAGLIFEKGEEGVTATERMQAKTVCLGVIYGMGPQAAAARLGITVQNVNSIVQSFYSKFSSVRRWISDTKSEAARVGQVRTILGRVRRLPDLTSKDKGKRNQAERQAVNSIIQGSASDIIKFAMLFVERALDVRGEGVYSGAEHRPQLLMQIHDELIYDVYVDATDGMDSRQRVHSFVNLLRHCMEVEVMNKLGICVPLVTNVRVGTSWGHLDVFSSLQKSTSSSDANAVRLDVASNPLKPFLVGESVTSPVERQEAMADSSVFAESSVPTASAKRSID